MASAQSPPGRGGDGLPVTGGKVAATGDDIGQDRFQHLRRGILGQEPGRALVHQRMHDLHRGERGNDEDRRVGHRCPQPLKSGNAADVGQFQVEHHQVGGKAGFEKLYRGAQGLDLFDLAIGKDQFQCRRQRIAVERMVVDNDHGTDP